MYNAIIIFTVGGLGCLARYLFYVFSISNISSPNIILLINLLGSFFAGVALEVFPKYSLYVITGFLGGFTTFSAFSLEALKLVSNNPVKAFIYIIISAFSCVLAAWCGSLLASFVK